jgi:hypothetical protein
MEISIDYESFGFKPIELLPPPPKKMLEEAEKEEAIYMREMLEKVLTIKEAKEIKLALWHKLCHPITQMIYDMVDQVRADHLRLTGNPRDDFWQSQFENTYRYDNPAMIRQNVFTISFQKKLKRRNLNLQRFKRENCMYSKGKKKGQYNFKWCDLARDIHDEWVWATEHGVKGEKRSFFYEKEQKWKRIGVEELYRFGYWNFMNYNHKRQRNLPKQDWSIGNCGLMP